MATYNLTSVKGNRTVSGTIEQAIEAAVEMECDLQPAYGVTIELDGETVAEVRDGKVEREDDSETSPTTAEQVASEMGEESACRWTVTTDAVTTDIEADDEDEAARRFAASEDLDGIESAADLREWAEALGSWCHIVRQ